MAGSHHGIITECNHQEAGAQPYICFPTMDPGLHHVFHPRAQESSTMDSAESVKILE
ncbi:unnamed protein product [Gulo gulo]|uniref:Uncharacterized protein n=1 Tax=Gulo gulo TaxID=48420 RepID=A0A9X9M926_GULGU|nr:unnamed protein product [Gulo gulo]